MVEETDMEKPGSSDTFPNGTGCTPWLFRMSVGTKLNFAFNNSSSNNNKKKIKKTSNVSTFQGLHLHEGIFAILTINAPKRQRSAGTWKFWSNATLKLN